MKYVFSTLLLLTLVLMGISQNVGIGTTTPTEKLHVLGNLRFDGALMPNNLPGVIGDALISQGPGVAPIWQSPTLGQQFFSYYSTGSVTPVVNGPFPPVDVIPGLNQNITIPFVGN